MGRTTETHSTAWTVVINGDQGVVAMNTIIISGMRRKTTNTFSPFVRGEAGDVACARASTNERGEKRRGTMAKTKIEWSDYSWNPISGCSKCSSGCQSCYAEAMERRFCEEWYGESWKPWTKANAAHNVRLHPDRLDIPLHWRKPRKVFVCSMGDLFHEHVPDKFIDQVFTVIALASQHSFQCLTKRPSRMARYIESGAIERVDALVYNARHETGGLCDLHAENLAAYLDWPLPNLWIGVTAENQKTADERIPLLLQTPAAKRFISIEPMLAPIDIGYAAIHAMLNLVIVGGESGPGARPIRLEWVRAIIRQCKEAGVPVFVKQLGRRAIAQEGVDPKGGMHFTGKGGDMKQWPEDLRIQEFPHANKR